MSETTKQDVVTTVVTPAAVLSFPHLFEVWRPKNNPNQKARYSCSLVFIPEIMQQFANLGTDLKKVKAVVVAAGRAKWQNFDELVKQGKLRLPFRRDCAAKGYPENAEFFNTSSERKPGIVMPFAGPDGKPAPLVDKELIYPGAIVRAFLNAYAYDNVGNGVSLGLNHIQWLSNGERLDNVGKPEDAFEVVEEGTAPASIDDLI